ncbi:MAG: DNA polymerase III subunit delta [Fibrella sp.]|nr:DNA polymerase III subunit delta [Armatimonadota bacterium]
MPAAKATTVAKKTAPAPVTDGIIRVVLLTGTEAGRKTAEANALAKAHADPTFADFDVETLDGGAPKNDRAVPISERALSSVAMVPMGEGRRIVILRDAQQIDDSEQKRLAEGLGRIPASGLLILHTGSPVTGDDGKAKKSSQITTELASAAKKYGEVREFALPKGGSEDVRALAIQSAKREGKTISPDALGMLGALPSEDIGRIPSEIAKAAAYVGDSAGVITGADLEAVLSRGPDDVIFKLCDAVGQRRTSDALGYVSQLFRTGSRPESVAPRTLVLLARQIRLIAQYRYLGEKRMVGRNAQTPTPEILALLPSDGAGSAVTNPRMSWMTEKFVGQARNFSLAELLERMEKLLQADLSLKGVTPGGDNPQAVIQRLVVELC